MYYAAFRGYIGFVQYYAEKKGEKLTCPSSTAFSPERTINTPLTLAAANGHMNVVEYIIRRTGECHSCKNLSDTLIAAVHAGAGRIVRYLLDLSDVNCTSLYRNGFDFINAVIESGDFTSLRYAVQKRGCNLNELDGEENSRNLLLSAAKSGRLDTLKYLMIEKKLRDTRSTPIGVLHYAALSGKLDIVRYLVETLHYTIGAGVLDSAASGGNLAVLKYLIDELGAKIGDADTLIFFAIAGKGNLDVVKYLIDEKRATAGELAPRKTIYYAVQHRKLDVTKYLAEDKNVSLNVKDENKKSLLHIAIEPTGWVDDDVEACMAVLKYLIDDENMLLRIDEPDGRGYTPAMYAARYGRFGILKFLIDDRHANTSIVDTQGNNMLHLASMFGKLTPVRYLLEEKRFFLYAKNRKGQTAYDIAKLDAVRTMSVLEYLQKKMNEQLWIS